jgi:DNA-binding response OmpR family regulator
MRILLVEDDKMIAEAVSNGLKTARYGGLGK